MCFPARLSRAVYTPWCVHASSSQSSVHVGSLQTASCVIHPFGLGCVLLHLVAVQESSASCIPAVISLAGYLWLHQQLQLLWMLNEFVPVTQHIPHSAGLCGGFRAVGVCAAHYSPLRHSRMLRLQCDCIWKKACLHGLFLLLGCALVRLSLLCVEHAACEAACVGVGVGGGQPLCSSGSCCL